MIPIKQTVMRDDAVSKKHWREASKEAWLDAGQIWHRWILRKHFTRAAIVEYNYARRSVGHERKKAKRFGHRRPLEFTGNLKRMVMRIRDVSSVGDGARGGHAKIKLHGPPYLHAFRRDLNQPEKARELSAISRQDADLLAKKVDKTLTAELKRKAELAAKNKTKDITKGHRA